MATEGQEIQDVPVEDTNPQQEEGGDDEVCLQFQCLLLSPFPFYYAQKDMC